MILDFDEIFRKDFTTSYYATEKVWEHLHTRHGNYDDFWVSILKGKYIGKLKAQNKAAIKSKPLALRSHRVLPKDVFYVQSRLRKIIFFST